MFRPLLEQSVGGTAGRFFFTICAICADLRHGRKELENLVSSFTKAGDEVSALKYQNLLDSKRAPLPLVPIERRVDRAFHALRAAE